MVKWLCQGSLRFKWTDRKGQTIVNHVELQDTKSEIIALVIGSTREPFTIVTDCHNVAVDDWSISEGERNCTKSSDTISTSWSIPLANSYVTSQLIVFSPQKWLSRSDLSHRHLYHMSLSKKENKSVSTYFHISLKWHTADTAIWRCPHDPSIPFAIKKKKHTSIILRRLSPYLVCEHGGRSLCF